MDRGKWRTMIAHALKGRGTRKEKKNLTCSNPELTVIFSTYPYKLCLLLYNPLSRVALGPCEKSLYKYLILSCLSSFLSFLLYHDIVPFSFIFITAFSFFQYFSIFFYPITFILASSFIIITTFSRFSNVFLSFLLYSSYLSTLSTLFLPWSFHWFSLSFSSLSCISNFMYTFPFIVTFSFFFCHAFQFIYIISLLYLFSFLDSRFLSFFIRFSSSLS